MKILFRTLLVFIAASTFFLLPTHSHANSLKPPKEVLSSWLLTSKDKNQLDAIAKDFEIVSRTGNNFEIYVPHAKEQQFKKLAPRAVLKSQDISRELNLAIKKDPNYLSGYRTFAQVQAALQTLAAQHPQFVHLSQIGISDEGRPQWVLKLSDNVQNDEEEPELMITAATHGDEIITTETILRFVEELVAGYGTNERITNIIDNNEIFFIPVVNPDGFTKRERYAAGRDPNRDYPWPEKEQRVSVPCIDNLIKFFHSRNIVGSIDFHAFGELVMYPWAYSRQAPDSADQLIFANLANQMAEINAYTAGQISQVIYIAKGSSADYYYWKNNTIAMAVELTRSKAPNSDQIPRILDETREMTLRFLENF